MARPSSHSSFFAPSQLLLATGGLLLGGLLLRLAR